MTQRMATIFRTGNCRAASRSRRPRRFFTNKSCKKGFPASQHVYRFCRHLWPICRIAASVGGRGSLLLDHVRGRRAEAEEKLRAQGKFRFPRSALAPGDQPHAAAVEHNPMLIDTRRDGGDPPGQSVEAARGASAPAKRKRIGPDAKRHLCAGDEAARHLENRLSPG